MKKRIVITGLGMIGDFGAGKEDFLDFIAGRKQKQTISDFDLDSYIDTSLLRRADQISCFASIAAKFALEDANLFNNIKNTYKFGAITATVHGALQHTIEYHKALVLDNPATVSPSLFSNSVLNAAVSCISNIFKIHGYTAAIPGYGGTHQAVKLAVELIGEGDIDICLVGGVDVNNEFLVEAYSSCIEDNTAISKNFGGSGFMVLESLESASKREAEIHAEVLGIEIIMADYKKALKYKIFPGRDFVKASVDCVFTSVFFDKDSRMREDLFLEHIGKDKIFPCGDLFGCTFTAAESFQIILSVMRLRDSHNRDRKSVV